MASRRWYLEQSILSYTCSKKQISIIKHAAPQFNLHGTSPYHIPIRVCGPLYCHRLFKSKVIFFTSFKANNFHCPRMVPYNMRLKLPAVPGWSLTTWGSNLPQSVDGPLQHKTQTFRFPFIVPYNMRLKLAAVPGWSLTTWGSNLPQSVDGPLQHKAQTFRFPWIVPYNMWLELSAVPGWWRTP
jgi:hypothetical protein